MDEIKNKKRYKYYAGEKYLFEKSQYLGKFIHGISTFFYPSGSKLAEIDFENGDKNGLLHEWSEDGVLLLECLFKNNKKHGAYFSYWNNGNIKEKGFYREGKKISKYYWYKQDGSLWRTYDYDNAGL